MDVRGLPLAALAALLVACGGNVTSTGGGGSSSGGTSSSGGSGGTSSGGSGGATATCSDFVDCCTRSCDLATAAAHCPNTPQPDCTCNQSGLPIDCMNRLTVAYRCILKVGASATKCDQSGNLALKCGVCVQEVTAASQACSGGDFKCAY